MINKMKSYNDSKEKLYVIPMMVETQKEALKKYCFGSCGKICLGAIDVPPVGPCWVCKEDVCPHEKGHLDEPLGSSSLTGEPVYLRGLRNGNE